MSNVILPFCIIMNLVKSYVEFFDFNGLDLFILFMYIPISYQVQVIHTYISYCFIFEVSDLCIVSALAMLLLQTSGSWTHNLYNT